MDGAFNQRRRVTEGRPALASSGLVTAAAADTQLHAFCLSQRQPEARRRMHALCWRCALACASALPHASGLWSHSLHRNHVGEQLWWWGVALAGASAADALWPLAGALHQPGARRLGSEDKHVHDDCRLLLAPLSSTLCVSHGTGP